MKAGGKLAVTAGCVALAPVLFLSAALGAILGTDGASSGGDAIACSATGAPTATVAGYSPEQIANAATIVAVGTQLQVPEYGWLIAIATAITESGLRNLNYGDRDSLGLFQQRPSMGWGSREQILNPSYAASQFYRHLLALPNWQQMSLAPTAQAVQRSGFPDRYAHYAQAARQLVGAVVSANSRAIPEDLEQFVSTCVQIGTGDCVQIQAPTAAAMTAIDYACQQLDVPYKWGGNGAELTELSSGQTQVTGGFDCSGLTRAAYAAAGVTIPRTAQTQYGAGPRVPAGAPILPGDLVFFGAGASAVTHVGIAVSAEYMIDAPHAGAVVRIERIWRSNFVGATRPGSQAVGAGSR